VYLPTNPEGRIDDIRSLTHIISNTSDFPDYEFALDNFVHVVKPGWIEQSIAKGRQSNPRQFSPDPCLIMSDVVVCCADIPQGDAEAIAGGVLAMGGQYAEQLSKTVTHLVALNPDQNAKCKLAVQKNLKCDIVLPHWLVPYGFT
jgi:twin BRCT domain